MKGRVLIIAGSDSGGGAGIQADIKTVTALGGYAATAVTALTAQDTKKVHSISAVDPAFVAEQTRVVLDDIGADCIKTGMLANAKIIEAVADILDARDPELPLVVDPVMVSKSGDKLLDQGARQALKARLILKARVFTPNVPEAEALTGMKISNFADFHHAATMLLTLGSTYVLLKGGHMKGDLVRDILVREDEVFEFESQRINSIHTHGTGCSLASAIATGIAQGFPVPDAVERARYYVLEAIKTAPGFGSGNGPLNHGHTVAPLKI
jgi:hydroxymethylpyrimidine/phosphomethylpyrimidine kinase